MLLTKYIKRNSRPHFAIGILVTYLISLLGLVLESSHSHESNSVTCNKHHHPSDADLCHLRLDHHDLLNGCKHPEHISNTKPHCLLCDVLLHFDFAIVSIDFYRLNGTYIELNPFHSGSSPIISLLGLHNKAPPSIFC